MKTYLPIIITCGLFITIIQFLGLYFLLLLLLFSPFSFFGLTSNLILFPFIGVLTTLLFLSPELIISKKITNKHLFGAILGSLTIVYLISGIQ